MAHSLRLKRKYTQILVMKGQDSETFSLYSFQKTEAKDTVSTIYKFLCSVALLSLRPKL